MTEASRVQLGRHGDQQVPVLLTADELAIVGIGLIELRRRMRHLVTTDPNTERLAYWGDVLKRTNALIERLRVE